MKNIILLLAFFIILLSCGTDEGYKPKPNFGPLKYVITNSSDNIVDTVYLHSDYDNYKSGIVNPHILNKNDKFSFCPKSNMYLTFRRPLSKNDNKKIYVTTANPLSYKYGIIKIDLGDSDFYIEQVKNNSNSCTTD